MKKKSRKLSSALNRFNLLFFVADLDNDTDREWETVYLDVLVVLIKGSHMTLFLTREELSRNMRDVSYCSKLFTSIMTR